MKNTLADVFSEEKTVAFGTYQVHLQVIQSYTYTRSRTTRSPIAPFDPDQVWARDYNFLKLPP